MRLLMKSCVTVLVAFALANTAMALSCRKCGKSVLASDSFCQKCGSDVAESHLNDSYPSPYQIGGANSLILNHEQLFDVNFSCGLLSPCCSISIPYPGEKWRNSCLRGISFDLLSGYAEAYGFQVGLIANFPKKATGIQLGFVNSVKGDVDGLQIGFANGSEWGKMTGVQLGILNEVKDLCGVQVGLLNVVHHGTIPFFPLINIGW